ncbi:response regulator [Methylobacterium sp. WSM2598]|uniref:response regulator n=1 Tax=Methylobacterium sp. WSM2598 TaxID=398261 RepID=UPI00037F86D6|nr:response regulator [Methylobacterium sp. WSM2598]
MSVAPTTSLPVVLVVEDEALVRMTAVDMLEDAGFAVVEAATADAAWTVLETEPAIRALFTDIEMPGSMNGLELASRVAERWPHIRLVLTSGRARLRDQDIPDSGQFVPKPYHPDQLRSAFAHA